MTASVAAIEVVTRPDVVNFHKHVLKKGSELHDKTRDLMLKQGIYAKPPYKSTPDKMDFVEK